MTDGSSPPAQDVELALQGVRKVYGSRSVLDDVCLEVFRGEALSIIGPSGSGKSTLLKTINQLVVFKCGIDAGLQIGVDQFKAGKGDLLPAYRSPLLYILAANLVDRLIFDELKLPFQDSHNFTATDTVCPGVGLVILVDVAEEL